MPSSFCKPYPEFPLSYHPASGRLYKKIKGTRYYFGYGKDWKAALEKYEFQREDLYAGRKPREYVNNDERITLMYVCNHLLDTKRERFLLVNGPHPLTFTLRG